MIKSRKRNINSDVQATKRYREEKDGKDRCALSRHQLHTRKVNITRGLQSAP